LFSQGRSKLPIDSIEAGLVEERGREHVRACMNACAVMPNTRRRTVTGIGACITVLY
jgi:hypothetical protein